MDFLIITGMSGAGKSSAIRALEDIGYYCVDNMPPALLTAFARVLTSSSGKIDKIALVIDLRSGDMFGQLFDSLDELTNNNIKYDILFLYSSDTSLVSRYKQNRRNHPLSSGGELLDSIKKEREILADVRSRATYIIDTSRLSPAEFKDELVSVFSGKSAYKGIVIEVMSFGFKHGLPIDVDLVFDVRFLPNPYYVDELRDKTGLDSEVSDFVFSFPQTGIFLEKLNDMLDFLMGHYIEEGKNQLVIAIGCTGGKHRSVAIAEAVAKFLSEKNYRVTKKHRDYAKPN
ncbi:MAG: RNase adapter RapZ [Monoglobales bacterium]